MTQEADPGDGSHDPPDERWQYISGRTRTGKETHRGFKGSVRAFCGVRLVAVVNSPVTCRYCGPDPR
jgi:hypothetical protein